MRTYSLTAVAAAVAILLSGCAAAGSGGAAGPSATGSTVGAARATAPASGAAPTASAATAASAENALTLTGAATAHTIPDMVPVVRDARPVLPARVKDSTGRTITVSSAKRILALDLYGTLTDTVIGLGLQQRLVGRSNSDTQRVLHDRPVVTSDGHDLNVEAVLNLRPDVVLTNTTIGNAAEYRRLEAAGVTVVRFAQVPHLSGIRPAIEQVGRALGMSQAAAQLAAHTDDELRAARRTIAALRAKTPRKPRAAVLYVRGTAGVFFILGADYGAGDVIDTLGLDDVAAKHGITTLKPASAEGLVSLDPEILLAMSQGVASTGGVSGLLKRPGVSATTAGEHRRIVMAADSQLLSYGPRTPAILVALARAIYTDNS
ncbi:heme/hemin ABC transporter substrate-binding protein [Flexivirga caeni]|uniref:Hemin receptor n=1 Tax=Flexivirga caeni TaxID=2294115 RepID=A0A3M9M450_9MICO|nr:ABC transporter substrate-binding protein [Flexivirga caeni]RNI20330.1 hemin receptor [Flexivirga caeni]